MTSSFTRSSVVIAAILIAAVIEFMLLPTPSQAEDHAAAQSTNSFAVRDVRVFNGHKVVPHANVVVRDGIIKAAGADTAIPDGLKLVDGDGKTLLPGLIDSHVHTYGHSRSDALRFGVTTELGMGTDWHLLAPAQKQRNTLARTNKADLWSAGMLATVPHGHGTEYPMPIEPLTRPGQARHWVDQRIREGSDYIKIILDDGSLYGKKIPTLKPATVKALITAAHRRGKLAVIHIAKLGDARLAVKAGVDGLAHIFVDKPADDDLINRIKRNGTFVIATLSVYSTIGCGSEAKQLLNDPDIKPFLAPEQSAMLKATFPRCQPRALQVAIRNAGLLHAAGVPILAGTDAGNPGTAHGASLHGELKLLVKAGLTPIEALRAATAVPAQYFDLDDRGRIAPGLRADLLLVNGNPTRDITATRDIAAIWMNGFRIDRNVMPARESKTAQPADKAPAQPLISDFDQNRIASHYGNGWHVTTDKRVGGHSSATMKLVSGGANDSTGGLEITGQTQHGFIFPWAGAIFFPGDKPMQPLDFSGRTKIVFWARGDGGTYSVMLFSGARQGGPPPMQHFTAGNQWQKITLKLAGFSGADPSHLAAIAFVAGPDTRQFHFRIDHVAVK